MNLNKILFSLILLTSLSPALGMEGIVKDETPKPTFGKLVDSKVWAAVIAIKKHLAELEIENGHATANLPVEVLWEIVEYSLTQPEPEKIQANIILELLSDPNFEFLHSLLINFIKKYDLLIYTYLLATKWDYPEEVQVELKSTISKAALKAFTTQFSDNPNFSEKNDVGELLYDDKTNMRKLEKSFAVVGLDGNNDKILCSYLTAEDFETLIHHMFDVDPTKFSSNKLNHVFAIYKWIILYSREHNIDLNFENKNGITPLMWTTFGPDTGYTPALQEAMILSGVNIDYVTLEGKSFKDLAKESDFNRLMKFEKKATTDMLKEIYGPNQRLYKPKKESSSCTIQ